MPLNKETKPNQTKPKSLTMFIKFLKSNDQIQNLATNCLWKKISLMTSTYEFKLNEYSSF